jgi:diaminohydroxyphosphoribosylaminopyrimidine deaminase/5-amino-6-(5-phosphoribosylamino)uracil reductase
MVSQVDQQHMKHALRLALRGLGLVEPNPLVGCVIAIGERVVAEGWHQQFGGPHAEVVALRAAADQDLSRATMYVTLEPCSHHGKTPPCVDAILAAGVRRLYVAQEDPFPAVRGHGIQALVSKGVDVSVGLLGEETRQLTAPYFKLVEQSRPWVLAKWAMSLDGKIATRTGNSKWISNDRAREIVHRLRGRVDGIIIGRQTAACDDPLLTARPPGPRNAARIVLDSRARLNPQSQLVRTAQQTPVIVAVGANAPPQSCDLLRAAGCEIVRCQLADENQCLMELLDELGRRRMTNVLLEGGADVLGSFLDRQLIDEAHVFIAPKLLGGANAVPAVRGCGIAEVADAVRMVNPVVEILDDNIYIHGRLSVR